MSYRSRKQTTPDDNGDRSSCEYPVVSIAALLRLASWSGNFRASSQGGSPCHGRLTPLSPPPSAGPRTRNRPDSEAHREAHPSGEAASVAPDSQPDHRPSNALATALPEGSWRVTTDEEITRPHRRPRYSPSYARNPRRSATITGKSCPSSTSGNLHTAARSWRTAESTARFNTRLADDAVALRMD